MRAFIRWVQSSIAYWDGDYDEAAQLVEAGLSDATTAEYRTVPIIGRARSLHTLLGQRPNLASPTLTTLRDDLAEFVTHPALTPPALEPDTQA